MAFWLKRALRGDNEPHAGDAGRFVCKCTHQCDGAYLSLLHSELCAVASILKYGITPVSPSVFSVFSMSWELWLLKRQVGAVWEPSPACGANEKIPAAPTVLAELLAWFLQDSRGDRDVNYRCCSGHWHSTCGSEVRERARHLLDVETKVSNGPESLSDVDSLSDPPGFDTECEMLQLRELASICAAFGLRPPCPGHDVKRAAYSSSFPQLCHELHDVPYFHYRSDRGAVNRLDEDGVSGSGPRFEHGLEDVGGSAYVQTESTIENSAPLPGVGIDRLLCSRLVLATVVASIAHSGSGWGCSGLEPNVVIDCVTMLLRAVKCPLAITGRQDVPSRRQLTSFLYYLRACLVLRKLHALLWSSNPMAPRSAEEYEASKAEAEAGVEQVIRDLYRACDVLRHLDFARFVHMGVQRDEPRSGIRVCGIGSELWHLQSLSTEGRFSGQYDGSLCGSDPFDFPPFFLLGQLSVLLVHDFLNLQREP